MSCNRSLYVKHPIPRGKSRIDIHNMKPGMIYVILSISCWSILVFLLNAGQRNGMEPPPLSLGPMWGEATGDQLIPIKCASNAIVDVLMLLTKTSSVEQPMKLPVIWYLKTPIWRQYIYVFRVENVALCGQDCHSAAFVKRGVWWDEMEYSWCFDEIKEYKKKAMGIEQQMI